MSAAVELRNVGFRYGERRVLHGVDAAIPEGRLCALLGPNGSGKTTLLRIMAGLLRGGEGCVHVMGRDVAACSAGQRARLVGYLPQQHRAIFPFSVRDVVLTGRAAHVRFTPGDRDLMRARHAMETVGIAGLADRRYTELSGGEQQLVLIARVLAQEARVVLLDEPTSHLDFRNRTCLMNLLRELVAGGLTVIVVLHNPNTAFLYGDRFLFLKAGRLQTPPSGGGMADPRFLHDLYAVDVDTVSLDNGRSLVIPRSPREPEHA